jgi:hypothetical protein
MNGWSARDYPTPESTPSPPATIKQERAPSEDLIPASSSPDLKSSTTLPLPLEEDRRDQQQVDKQRTVPCEQCRKIRRACKWIEREGKLETCERCRTTGKQCSGPTRYVECSIIDRVRRLTWIVNRIVRRSPSTLEVQVQFPPARQRQPTKRTASIGPSSPEARWSTLHLSYSLKYHLVESEALFLSSSPLPTTISRSRFRSLHSGTEKLQRWISLRFFRLRSFRSETELDSRSSRRIGTRRTGSSRVLFVIFRL